MNDIRTFVGHSFTSDDKEVVDRFLVMFDKISKLHPSFSWQNAKEAEAALISGKVLELLEGKNVFIGICTKRELVSEDKLL